MHTIVSGLLAGLVVGVVCIVYVLFRTRKMATAYKGRTSVTLMILTIFGSGSMVWGFIGAELYHLIHLKSSFFLISLSLAVLSTFVIWRTRTTFARDKVLLTLIVFIGLGVLIPIFYDTLKLFY